MNELTKNQIEALKNLAKSRGVKLAPNADYFRKVKAYKAKYKALAALPPVKKTWSEKAVAALKAYAKRVGFPGIEDITPENAREMQKQVKAFAATAPAKPGQIAQIEKLGLHEDPASLSYAEAHQLLSEHGRAVWERLQQKAA